MGLCLGASGAGEGGSLARGLADVGAAATGASAGRRSQLRDGGAAAVGTSGHGICESTLGRACGGAVQAGERLPSEALVKAGVRTLYRLCAGVGRSAFAVRRQEALRITGGRAGADAAATGLAASA